MEIEDDGKWKLWKKKCKAMKESRARWCVAVQGVPSGGVGRGQSRI